ncbi:hypothetical protein G6F43_004522 [Rhizopus delemar]|nr:hypothetical protein G6F43_004522 [Rhizopus delemar]
MNVETPDNDDSEGLGYAFFTAEATPLKYKHKHPKTTTRGSCREYTAEKIEKLLELIIDEGYNAKYAVLLTGIKVRTAQSYLKMYNNDTERRLSGTYNNPRGRPLYQRLKSGQQTPDSDFSKNHVFVDEAGFNLHIQRNRGRSEK